MSFDLSRLLYLCPGCQVLPCTCVRPQVSFQLMTLTCHEGNCGYTCFNMTDMGNHHLDHHERPLPLTTEHVPLTTNGTHAEGGA